MTTEAATYPAMVPGHEFVFTSPYDQYRERIGQHAIIVAVVPEETYDADECGPMFYVLFDDDETIEAWPEEIDPAVMA